MNSRSPSSFRTSALVRWIENEEKHQMVSESLTDPLLEGEVDTYKVKQGFSLHWGSTTELRDHHVISTARNALIFIVLVEGKLDFSYDDLSFVMDAQSGSKGLVVNLAKPATFRRTVHSGNKVSKLKVLVPLEWIQERIEPHSPVAAFVSQHLANFELSLNDHFVDLVSQIIKLHNSNESFKKMKLETLAQGLLLEVFEQLSVEESVPVTSTVVSERSTVTSSAKQSINDVIHYIEDNLDKELTAKDLAEYSATSESNLRRKFKQVIGCSVKSYITRRRLDVARKHLEQGLASITEVAYHAGYRHPSNFTNAYKKAFGYPPTSSVNKRD
ncbi:putative transcriptional regulator, AraC/XylS family protein [Vibrio sinaloensis DSM 21326]|uniref:Putative transcriptional regulator, AraC/XylS family protein n=1 Tax=Vibrio sinaloensis DSM 21326 TaxID=945550 RepID=E8MC25_PHOS4|nr:AraC family transcriptional regulator [Vibrio sinaloensis]EGA68429.1 putative transcriptional regulator, AraC/XylS family protein [Vibrio sinaloensis DSM 21326]